MKSCTGLHTCCSFRSGRTLTTITVTYTLAQAKELSSDRTPAPFKCQILSFRLMRKPVEPLLTVWVPGKRDMSHRKEPPVFSSKIGRLPRSSKPAFLIAAPSLLNQHT